jgi:hypothetical protein
MRENMRGYRRKTVNLHVELVSDEHLGEFCMYPSFWRKVQRLTILSLLSPNFLILLSENLIIYVS